MQRAALSFLVVGTLWACGPSMEADHVKTPDEIIAEQEQAGAEQMQKDRSSGAYDDTSAGETDEDRRRGWDAKQGELEMSRAANSAESCPESVTEKSPKGKATISATFGNDGHVKSATISDPYGESTAVGKCVLRAIKAVIVPAYQGAEQTVNWEIDLTGAKKSSPVGGFASEEDGKKK
jgi:hypothetical protein